MLPVALLLFYEPDKIYKNRKYFLTNGDNTIGSSPNSTVYLQDSTIPHTAAIIRIRNNLITLLKISDCSVEVLSNLFSRTKCFLPLGVEYTLQEGKQFKIGLWRGIFQAKTVKELLNLKDIVNRQLFECSLEQETLKSQSEDNNPTLLIDNNDAPTLIIGQANGDATLLINNNGNMDATLIIPSEYAQRTQVVEAIQQMDESSMAATLQDNEQNNNAMIMKAATEEIQVNKSEIDNNKRLSKTVSLSVQNPGRNQIQKVVKQNDMWRDFFQADSTTVQPANQSSFSNSNSAVRQPSSQVLVRTIDQVSSPSLKVASVLTSSTHQVEQVQKKLSFSGCQPTEMQKLNIQKMKMVIKSPDQDYDILLVNQNEVRITPRLIKALFLGKEIKSVSYINNGSGKILTKIYGQTWDSICKKQRNDILKNDQIYVSDKLSQYREFISMGGGQLIGSLDKSKSKHAIKVILMNRDKDIYQEFKNYKKWKFFTQQALQQSLIVAESLVNNDLTDKYFI